MLLVYGHEGKLLGMIWGGKTVGNDMGRVTDEGRLERPEVSLQYSGQRVESCVVPSLSYGSLCTIVYVLSKVECCEYIRLVLCFLQ